MEHRPDKHTPQVMHIPVHDMTTDILAHLLGEYQMPHKMGNKVCFYLPVSLTIVPNYKTISN